MCGRFTATFEFTEIRVRWNLDRDLPNYMPRFNVVPEKISPTIPSSSDTGAATSAGSWTGGAVQLIFADNDSQGLRYGTSGTPEKFF